MIGKYPAKLDDKNRLIVPAKLRGELGDSFFYEYYDTLEISTEVESDMFSFD